MHLHQIKWLLCSLFHIIKADLCTGICKKNRIVPLQTSPQPPTFSTSVSVRERVEQRNEWFERSNPFVLKSYIDLFACGNGQHRLFLVSFLFSPVQIVSVVVEAVLYYNPICFQTFVFYENDMETHNGIWCICTATFRLLGGVIICIN